MIQGALMPQMPCSARNLARLRAPREAVAAPLTPRDHTDLSIFLDSDARSFVRIDPAPA